MNRKLNKAQKQAILDWFEEFESTIDQRIDAWLATVPEHQRIKLDKSPESLLTIGDYLIDNFAKSIEVKEPTPEVARIIYAIVTYIGEVHRLNYPGGGVWKPHLLNGPIYDHPRVFKAVVGIEAKDYEGGNYPDEGIEYVVHNRARDEIYKCFLACYGHSKEWLQRKPQKPMPGRGGESYHHYCLKLKDTIKFSELAEQINEYFKGTSDALSASYHNEKRLLIDAGDNYYFHFYHRQDFLVKSIAEDVNKAYNGDLNRDIILGCDTIFEFWGDQDDDGKCINHHIDLMQFMNMQDGFIVYSDANNCMWDDF